jgi:hypothetical protein
MMIAFTPDIGPKFTGRYGRARTSLQMEAHLAGRYAALSGGASSSPFSQELGYLYVIDLRSRTVVATVTGLVTNRTPLPWLNGSEPDMIRGEVGDDATLG